LEYFHKVEAEFWNKQQHRVLPLLVFDQFEEIFTLGKSEDRVHISESFLDELADLAEGTPPGPLRNGGRMIRRKRTITRKTANTSC